jgi:hypothetical protein
MVNWNNPTNSSTYTSVLTDINEKASNLAKQDYGTDTNVPTGAIRFNSTGKAWERWSGSAWAERAGTERAFRAVVTTTGTQPTYVATPTVAWASYVAGDVLVANIHSSNTSTSGATINVSGLGAKTIRWKGRTLKGGELVSGNKAVLVYDGTDFILCNHGGGWVSWSPTITGVSPMTVSGVSITNGVYQADGDIVRIQLLASLTTSITASNRIRFTLPVTGETGEPCIYGSALNFAGVVVQSGTAGSFDLYRHDITNHPLTTGSIRVHGDYRLA